MIDKSRPTRACELKLKVLEDKKRGTASRPTRACELKSVYYYSTYNCASHALHGRVS